MLLQLFYIGRKRSSGLCGPVSFVGRDDLSLVTLTNSKFIIVGLSGVGYTFYFTNNCGGSICNQYLVPLRFRKSNERSTLASLLQSPPLLNSRACVKVLQSRCRDRTPALRPDSLAGCCGPLLNEPCSCRTACITMFVHVRIRANEEPLEKSVEY